jgi:hypothetical protein
MGVIKLLAAPVRSDKTDRLNKPVGCDASVGDDAAQAIYQAANTAARFRLF